MSRTAFFPAAPIFDPAPRQYRQSMAQPALKTGGGKTQAAPAYSWMTQAIARNMSPRAQRLMRADY